MLSTGLGVVKFSTGSAEHRTPIGEERVKTAQDGQSPSEVLQEFKGLKGLEHFLGM